MPEPAGDLSCREVVELATAYLEGTLTRARRGRFEQHLTACLGCDTYLTQMRQTIDTLGGLREESLTPDQRDRLLAAFRGWQRA